MCHLNLHHKYDFKNAEPFEIDKEVVTITTSWPSGGDVSAIGTALGTVAIVGEMVHSEEDLEDDELWRASSWDHNSEDPLRPHPYHGWLYRPCRFRIPHLKWKYHNHFLVLFVLCT